MLTIIDLRAASLDKDRIDLYWAYAESTFDPLDYTFTIERSESAMGPWQQLCEPFSDRYHYRDIQVNLYHAWRQLWYRIKVTRISDSAETYSGAVSLEAPPDLIAQEVRRQESVLFRQYIGRPCWVYPVRTFGHRCPACYDWRTGSKLTSQCLTCYDTTFLKGYLAPVLVPIQIDPSPKSIETMSLAETQQQNTSARAMYFPPLKPRDVIIELENRRWRVKQVSMTQRARAVLHQELVLHEIPPEDIEYRLPLDVDLSSIETKPAQMFTNAQHPDGVTADWWQRTKATYGFK